MKLAVAQTRPIKGDISANILAHRNFVDLAASQKADAIFFPELSITGYEPQLAKALATHQDDKAFDDFQEMSNKYKIVIGIGMPIKANSGIKISILIFQSKQPRITYSKQQLHDDELPYFVHGEQQIILTVGNKNMAPSIC